MKKVLFFALVASIATLSSCKKDYTCACKDTAAGALNVEIKDAKKKDAEKACEAAQTTYKMSSSNATCSLND